MPEDDGSEKAMGAILREIRVQIGQGSKAMPTDNLKLMLTPLEVEVAEAALELYLQARPVPIDDRFEYRYRAARSVLESLRQRHRELGTFARGDDEETGRTDDERRERRPLRERTED